MIKISIIVCCYNSKNRLNNTLKTLSSQNFNNVEAELIIVDNKSTDNTSLIAQTLWEEFGNPYSCTILYESKQGLSFARWCGINASQGEYIIFCDDDNWLDTNYIQNAINIMDLDSKLGALCGKNIGEYEIEPEQWFKKYESALAIGHSTFKTTYLKEHIAPWGAGLVIRKSFFVALQSVGFQSLLQDRAGKELSSGGDTEFCYILRLLGYTWKYDENLTLKHFVPANRINLDYLKKLYFGFGKAQAVITYYYGKGEEKNLHSKLLWIVIYLSEKRNQTTLINSKKGIDKTLQIEWSKGFLSQLMNDKFCFSKKRAKSFELLQKLKK